MNHFTKTQILVVLIYLVCFNSSLKSQGLINNGTYIVLTGNSSIYVDANAGNYTTQSASGLITPSTTSSLTLLGNWINNSSPANNGFSSDAGQVILGGSSQSIGGSNPTAFYNLTLAGSGTKSLSVSSTSVGGQSTFTGVLALTTQPLDLNGNLLNITNSASGAITNSSGYIISETNSAVNPSIVRWYMRNTTGSHIIPFGVSGSQIPFAFNITSAMTTTDYVSVSTRATTSSNNIPWAGVSNVNAVTHMQSPLLGGIDGSVQVVIDRWWDITPSNSVTANVTFSYRGSENTLSAPYQTGSLGAQHWTGSYWDFPNGSATAVTSGIGSVTANGLSSFSPYVLASTSAPLPIELLYFEGNCENEQLGLTWCTATETNNHYFTIEQSQNGNDYLPITTVVGAGNSSSKTCYSYSLGAINTEGNYYRLSQTDFDNTTKLLSTIYKETCSMTYNKMTITNNTTGNVGVIVNSSIDKNYTVLVNNTLGQLIFSQPIKIKKGFNHIPLNLNPVTNGIYYVSILDLETIINSKKIIISSETN